MPEPVVILSAVGDSLRVMATSDPPRQYLIDATREGAWWLLTIPEIDRVTQARRLDQAEAMARDLIAVWLEIPADSFNVTVTVTPPPRPGA